jgi:hypothetical protein
MPWRIIETITIRIKQRPHCIQRDHLKPCVSPQNTFRRIESRIGHPRESLRDSIQASPDPDGPARRPTKIGFRLSHSPHLTFSILRQSETNSISSALRQTLTPSHHCILSSHQSKYRVPLIFESDNPLRHPKKPCTMSQFSR